VLWNETASGDLSNNKAAPNAFTLAAGTNSVIGSVTGATDLQDWIALTVPAGLQLSQVVLTSYQSADVTAFTGVQRGSSFVGNEMSDPAAFLGYAHFGPGNVGSNILPAIAAGPGAQGFTPPLGSDTYTFLIQQIGATTTYQFNYVVTPVPEPASLGLTGLAGVGLLAGWLKRRTRPAATD
jgi:hypothetical protein